MTAMPALVRTTCLVGVQRVGRCAQLNEVLQRLQRSDESPDQALIVVAVEPGKPRRPSGNGALEGFERARPEAAVDLHGRLASPTESASGPRIPRGRAEGRNVIERKRTMRTSAVRCPHATSLG